MVTSEKRKRFGTTEEAPEGYTPPPPPPDDTSSEVVRTHDGTGNRPKPEEWIGRSLGKYRITGQLGAGGMGLVYEAADSMLDRDVAIKILPDDLARNERTRNRFLAEARAAARLNHPHVVQIHEVGEVDDTYFIVMELVRGGNVAERVERDGPLGLEESTRICIEACEGMQAAHEAGLVHRDVKPANLMLTSTGQVKIGDFGLAKGATAVSVELTREGTALGTPAFMSPEQCEARRVDRRSDVYSLGGTYHKLLTGRDPFAGAGDALKTMYAHCRSPVPDPREVDPAIPVACTRVIARAMAKRPEDRFPTAIAMRAELQEILFAESNTVIGANAVPAGESAVARGHAVGRHRASRLPPILGAVGVVAVVLVVAAVGWLPGVGNSNESPASDDAPPLDQGITADTITLGTSTAYSGASRDLGVNMVHGLRAAFEEANATGGVHGRDVRLLVLDDGYEPARALANVEELVERRKVFAIVGDVGTATAELTAPYCVERRRLFFAPFTGARFLRRNPPDRYVFNVRAGCADETAAIVRYFVEVAKVPPDEIAVFAQDDSYGDDGYHGVVHALRAYGVEPDDVLRVGHARNSIRVEKAVETVVSYGGDVSAIVMVSTYGATARFVRGVRDAGVKAEFASVSFVGSELLAERFREIGSEYGEGVIVTRVVPDTNSNSTGVLRYRNALAKYVPEASPGSVSLEGYIAGRVLVAGLRRAGRDLDTETLVDALEDVHDLDLGIGPVIQFGPSRHQASDEVWASQLDDEGNYQPLDLDGP